MTDPTTAPTTGATISNEQRERIILECFDEFGSRWIVDPAADDNPDDPEDPDFWDEIVDFTITAVLKGLPATRVIDDADVAALRHLVADHKLVQTEVRQALRDTTTADLARIARFLGAQP